MRLVLDVPGIDTNQTYHVGEHITLQRDNGPTYFGYVTEMGSTPRQPAVEQPAVVTGNADAIESEGTYGHEFVRRALVEFRSTDRRKIERLATGNQSVRVSEREYGSPLRTRIKQLFNIKEVTE